MVGFGHDFAPFDIVVPYDIIKIGEKDEGFGRVDMAIMDKVNARVAYSYQRNYRSYGKDAFYPFKYEGRWYALFGPKYYKASIVDLESGKVVADMPNKACGGNWCPQNFYVPAIYRNTEQSSFELQGKPYYATVPDYAFREFKDPEEQHAPYDEKHLRYLDTAFMAGVFWAADHEWLVYRFSISEAMKTGVIPEPRSDYYCFEFDYEAKPEIRQYVKSQDFGEDPETFDIPPRFYYYDQKFADAWHEPNPKAEAK